MPSSAAGFVFTTDDQFGYWAESTLRHCPPLSSSEWAADARPISQGRAAKVAMQRRLSCGDVAARDPMNGSRRDSMQGTVVRLLIGAGMMVLALIFTGILAVGLEERAEDRQPADDT